MNDAEPKEIEENKQKRLAAMRLASDIDAYNNQGVEASDTGFKIGEQPTILKIPLEGLTQKMLMFSPDWHRVQGASGKSDEEFMQDLGQEDAEVRERMRKAKEAEERKKEEERKLRAKEDAMLNMSAKLTKDGYIEIKLGEDIPAMQEAYRVHMEKVREGMHKNIPQEQLDAAGLKNYSWEEFKRYYRKMHGMPEDGIKRIPITAQKKPREIDWSKRYPLSVEELGKFGIHMSEDGPVMIPLDKAMEVANSLLKDAKTIYSIRDGLEVMKEGLDSETKTLKEKREGGMPVGIIANGADSGSAGKQVDPYPATASSDFESRF